MQKTFAKILKHCRSLDGRSQLDLALAANISARHLSFLESGRADPGRDVVVRLAAELRVSDAARSALYASSGFAPDRNNSNAPARRRDRLARMLRANPYPSVLVDDAGRILVANPAMRVLHAFVTGAAIDIEVMTAAELALGPCGFGRSLANRDDLAQRFAHCATLERLLAGTIAPRAIEPAPQVNEMILNGPGGRLSFDLIEMREGHPLHASQAALRIYGMVPADLATERSVAAMIKRQAARLSEKAA